MTAIEFENISKQYRLGLVSTKTLSHDLNRWWAVNVRGKEEATLLNDQAGLAADEPIRVKLHVKRNSNQIKEFQAGLLINNSEDVRVGTFTAPMVSIPENALDEFDIVMQLNNHNFGKGKFYLDFNIGYKDHNKGARNFDVVKNVLSFEVKYLTLKDKSEGQEYVLWSHSWGDCCFQDGSVEIV